MGCTVFVVLVGPIWLLIAASVLQVAPGLRGQWMVDGLTGEIEFVQYGAFAMWLRGGAVATAVLGAASPLMVMLANFSTGMGRISAFRAQAQTSRYAGQAGLAELDVPLVVRKRKKGKAVAASFVRVIDASPLRRFLARSTDHILLLLSAGGGALLVVFMARFTENELGSIWIVVVSVGIALWLIRSQWSLLHRQGQTFGKFVCDIRVVDSHSEDRLPMLRSLGVRQGGAGLFGVVVALLFGGLAATFVVEIVALGFAVLQLCVLALTVALTLFTLGLEDLGLPLMGLQVLALSAVTDLLALFAEPPQLDPSVAPIVAAVLGAGLGWVTADLFRTLPLLFDREAPHDRLAGSRVVRSSVAEPFVGDVPVGFRLIALGIDLLGVVAVAGLPVALVSLIAVAFPSVSLGSVALLGAFGCGGGLLVYAVAQALRISSRGASFGKALVGLRVVRASGAPVGFVDGVFTREIVGRGLLWLVLPGLGLLIDALAVLGDERRALHDQIAETRVIWAREFSPPKVAQSATRATD